MRKVARKAAVRKTPRRRAAKAAARKSPDRVAPSQASSHGVGRYVGVPLKIASSCCRCRDAGQVENGIDSRQGTRQGSRVAQVPCDKFDSERFQVPAIARGPDEAPNLRYFGDQTLGEVASEKPRRAGDENAATGKGIARRGAVRP